MLLMIGTSIVGVWEDLAAALTLCVRYHVNIIDDRALSRNHFSTDDSASLLQVRYITVAAADDRISKFCSAMWAR